MKDWFQVEMLDDTTYVISEHKHYEKTNCYLLLGKQRALLIDSGLGVADIRKITDQLTALPVTVIATHVHWDHIGSHGSYIDVLVHEREYSWLNGEFPLPLGVAKQQLMKEPCSFPGDFHLDAYTVWQGNAGIVRDGDILDLGVVISVSCIHRGILLDICAFLIWNGNGCTAGILSIKVFCTVIIRPLIHRHICCRYKGCKS